MKKVYVLGGTQTDFERNWTKEGKNLIALLKETSIVSMVGSTVGTLTFDLNQATTTINKSLANYLAPAILAALLYLLIVYTITLLIKLFERRLRVSDKR